MVRRKEFSLKFTDSLLLTGAEIPRSYASSRTTADDIFNDPEAWSDASLESGDDDEDDDGALMSEKAVVPYSAIASSKPQGEFLKPLSRKNSRRRRASFSSVSSPEYSPPKDLTVDIKRLSIVFSNGKNSFSSFQRSPSSDSPSTPSPASGKNSLLTPLVTTAVSNLRSPATAGVGSPIVVSASATWSFLEWLGTGSQPETPRHPPLTAGAQKPKLPSLVAQSSPRKSAALLMVPSPVKTPMRRPLPTVPAAPSPAQSSPLQPSPLQITSPPPPPPRGARVRRSPAPPPRIVESPPPLPPVPPIEQQQSQRPVRTLPPTTQQTAPLVPKAKAPIAWKAS